MKRKKKKTIYRVHWHLESPVPKPIDVPCKRLDGRSRLYQQCYLEQRVDDEAWRYVARSVIDSVEKLED